VRHGFPKHGIPGKEMCDFTVDSGPALTWDTVPTTLTRVWVFDIPQRVVEKEFKPKSSRVRLAGGSTDLCGNTR